MGTTFGNIFYKAIRMLIKVSLICKVCVLLRFKILYLKLIKKV